MYQTLTVDPESLIGDEQLGSKPKVWFGHDGQEWLFKETRANTGEDWAEKIAAEIAKRVGIKAAVVELACCRERNGSASRSFIDRAHDTLVHGNELLAGQITGYDRNKRQRQSDHTLDNIEAAITKVFDNLADIRDGMLTELAGYMVLDALIGNTDRHHENWGLVFRTEGEPDYGGMLAAAPSFDHASSLGRELTDERRSALLSAGHVGNYIRRGRGGIYLRSSDSHGPNPLRLVEVAARAKPRYFQPAVRLVASVPLSQITELIEAIPANRMSADARRFANAMLDYSYNALSELIL